MARGTVKKKAYLRRWDGLKVFIGDEPQHNGQVARCLNKRHGEDRAFYLPNDYDRLSAEEREGIKARVTAHLQGGGGVSVAKPSRADDLFQQLANASPDDQKILLDYVASLKQAEAAEQAKKKADADAAKRASLSSFGKGSK